MKKSSKEFNFKNLGNSQLIKYLNLNLGFPLQFELNCEQLRAL